MVRYIDDRGGTLTDPVERDRLLYWYVNTFLWGRYAASTESVLNRDLSLIENPDGALDRLIGELRQVRGSLELSPGDFAGYSRGARFYPMLYMLTRVWKSRDWDSGNELASHMLGRLSSLELHHIFPKAKLYAAEFELSQVNALANFTFLTKETNLHVSDRDPAEYLAVYDKKERDLITSHRIPTDPALWQMDRYPEFLARRRERQPPPWCRSGGRDGGRRSAASTGTVSRGRPVRQHRRRSGTGAGAPRRKAMSNARHSSPRFLGRRKRLPKSRSGL